MSNVNYSTNVPDWHCSSVVDKRFSTEFTDTKKYFKKRSKAVNFGCTN
jgi:hypothetical protein